MATLYNDGDLKFGSRVVTINSIAYIAESFTIDQPVQVVESTDELAQPRGSYAFDGFVTGSATLLFPDQDSGAPTRHMTFTSDDNQGVSKTWIVRNVSVPQTNNGETKCNITFAQKYSA
jgi:hypothetical protein